MSFRLVSKSVTLIRMTLSGVMALILRYFSAQRGPVASRTHCVKVVEDGWPVATIDMGRELGAVPFFWGELGPHL